MKESIKTAIEDLHKVIAHRPPPTAAVLPPPPAQSVAVDSEVREGLRLIENQLSTVYLTQISSMTWSRPSVRALTALDRVQTIWPSAIGQRLWSRL